METCAVVDQFCNSPANVYPVHPARGICFSCGQRVCSMCSTKRRYYNYGMVRLCNNCQVEYDGNDRRVMSRLNRLARRGQHD